MLARFSRPPFESLWCSRTLLLFNVHCKVLLKTVSFAQPYCFRSNSRPLSRSFAQPKLTVVVQSVAQPKLTVVVRSVAQPKLTVQSVLFCVNLARSWHYAKRSHAAPLLRIITIRCTRSWPLHQKSADQQISSSPTQDVVHGRGCVAKRWSPSPCILYFILYDINLLLVS